ncbi:unnamed protein product [Rotaria sordida]|uniref:UBC core domain-containing protein n=1 Tax=Rotaria sordida TaxID=392033 RepID=A0A814U012_9BILA|nr:unnamed protein product [Rotaria sordida]CAF1240029.1 unnamed protein product [Rotaria sordida]CAF1419710.1 unnamed protein product [Rotaria sordida]CAF3901645.1 unnamed protein product [Rotaria sordida]
MVGKQRDNQQSLLDLSTIALGIWCDKIVGYRFPQAIGLIYFGAAGIPINQKCPISKDLSQLEKASSNLPTCGNTTPMYDAIEMAIQSITSFRKDNEKQLSTECRSLIVCFSDGEDNSSVKASVGTIKSKLKNEKIVFDTIAFMKHESSNLVQLCEATKGFYYINVPYDKMEMAKLFEREASLMVCLRDEKSHVKVEKAEIRSTENLYQSAINVRNAKINIGQVSAMSNRRILKELDDLKKSSLDNFTVFLTQENSLFWKVIMKGPDGTPYAGYHWLLSVEFRSDFPFQPPNIRFITPIYHCNINEDGRICHDILQSKWTHQTTMRIVFQEILNLIRYPNPNYALSAVMGAQYISNRLDYEKSIKDLNEKEAKKTISEIMNEYKLTEE